MVRCTTLRILFALAVRKNFAINHMAVECAFLQGYLEEEVYMEQPKGFVEKGSENKV